MGFGWQDKDSPETLSYEIQAYFKRSQQQLN